MNLLAAMALVLGLLFGAPAQANPAGDRVRLLYVFTPAAKTVIGNDTAIKNWINSVTGTASYNNVTFNGGDTVWQVSLNSNGVIQYGTWGTNGDSQNSNSVGKVAVDIPMNELRDAMNADAVVVVTAAAGDSDISSAMDCSKSGAAAAKKAFVGVNIYGQTGGTGTAVEQRIMEALAKVQCAGESDSYAFMEGFNSSNCTLYRTLLDQTTSLQRDVWMVTENGLASPPGYSDVGPDQANAQMVLGCPAVDGLSVYTYTCAVTAACTSSPNPDVCYHTRTSTDTRGSPTCVPGSSGAGGCIVTQTVQSNWSKNNFTCTGGGGNSISVNLGLLSSNASTALYHGMKRGSSLKDAVGKMNARFGEAKLYYQTKIAPALKTAVQKAKE